MTDMLMGTGVFRLKGRQLYGKGIAEGRVANIQDVAARSGLTYTTAHRWIVKSDAVEGVGLENLASFLVDGLGLAPEEVTEMKFGDIFEFVPLPKEEPE